MSSQRPDGATLKLVSKLEERCSMWRYRCPVDTVKSLQHVNSVYSEDFDVAGVPWRIHLQQRPEPKTMVPFLALHLQYLGQEVQGTFAHFKLTVCNNNPDNAKEKTFHCHFKKHGSAWGLHHFMQMDRLFDRGAGFIDYGDGDEMPSEFDSPQRQRSFSSRPANSGVPAIVIDVIVRVLLPDKEGRLNMTNLPLYRNNSSGPSGQQPQAYQQSGIFQQQQSGALVPQQQQQSRAAFGSNMSTTSSIAPHQSSPPPTLTPFAQLQFPYDETLCDVVFSLSGGVEIKAHRCIIAARAPKLFAKAPRPVPTNATIEVTEIPDVFKAFLKFIYTEDLPERGVLRPEYIIDLYLLATEHEMTSLAEHCVNQVAPLLTQENILQIVASRYDASDDTLTALYLGVLYNAYDRLIEDPLFENIPGRLNRNLSLILRQKEALPPIRFTGPRHTLSAQLGMLAEEGAYVDHEIPLHDGSVIPCHKFVLASRSIAFNQALYQRTPNATLPELNTNEYGFSALAWSRFVAALYRGTLEPLRDVNAEEITLMWKVNDVLGLDGRLRRESESYVSPEIGARLMVYAEKHNVPKLREVALRLVSTNFGDKARADPTIWDVIGELSKDSLLNLFRTVTMGASEMVAQQQQHSASYSRR